MIYLLDFSIRSHIDSVVFFLLGASLFLSGNKWFLKQNFKKLVSEMKRVAKNK
jgi:hypothetical protein